MGEATTTSDELWLTNQDDHNGMYPFQETQNSNGEDDSTAMVANESSVSLSSRRLVWESALKPSEEHFRVLSLNVMAQCQCMELHPLTAPHVLKWPRRRERLLTEIARHDAHIACLQDIDNFAWWHKNLSDKVLYDLTCFEEDGVGVVVAWKRSLFQLVRSQCIALRNAAELATDPKVASRAHSCRNVAIVAHLIPFNESRSRVPLIVGSFQLIGVGPNDACPSRVDASRLPRYMQANLKQGWQDKVAVRLLQTRYMLQEIEKFNETSQAPIVLAGTNMVDADSYALVTQGTVRFVPRPPQPPSEPPSCAPDQVGITAMVRDARAISYSGVHLSWKPARVDYSRLDPPVETYYIQYRAGGSRILGWSEPIAVREIDAKRFRTQYERIRGRLRKKTEVDPLYHHIVAGLASGVSYEFRVAAESRLGRGPWSEPSAPFRTDFYRKVVTVDAPILPQLDETAEDARETRLSGKARLLLTAAETARSRQLGKISVSACVASCRELGIEPPLHKTPPDELRLLEQLRDAFAKAHLDFDLVSANPEKRRQARQRLEGPAEEAIQTCLRSFQASTSERCLQSHRSALMSARLSCASSNHPQLKLASVVQLHDKLFTVTTEYGKFASDFVFFSSDALSVKAALPFSYTFHLRENTTDDPRSQQTKELPRHVAWLPNDDYPSDHLAHLVVFGVNYDLLSTTLD